MKANLMSTRNNEMSRMQVMRQLVQIDEDIQYCEAIGDRLGILRLIKRRLELKRLL